MRTIDLILLLNDFKKNNHIFIEVDDQRLPVVDIEVSDNKIFLKTSSNLHGLKNWEFIVLLNKKEYYEFPIFYQYKNSHRQLFGFRVANDCLLLG
ncbi:hypothetical protein COSHB9_23030 [Companilactobacillus alimentarius]|uniref:Uncharacterized protein n=1 Tax=Companilactobacillus alimentarius DSM 20249 TaxID=1423720 RepID=A0A2K9HGN0_9LACO|nr:hypothetical protein [Companilactobacillus alimentarius]AUI71701.1 hypothetical protein LA20249_05675 [Companilactobacillus alimentarius DSM 20249]MDT6953306.1 hypothetical protein [Companilactobacillus alimentarius]GEO44555.1 hypothetical protein LAL01_07870 [Companilactobacillus alimentarius]